MIELSFHEKQALAFSKKATAAATLQDSAWFMKNAVKHADKAGLTIEEIEAKAMAIEAAKNAPVAAEAPAKQRCPHYAQIREFFGTARELGFDTSKDSRDRWRGALGMLLGRRIESRSELTGAEWAFATNALRMGKLFI